MKPFEIDIQDASITDMKRRIRSHRWPTIGFDAGWNMGTNDGVLRSLAGYWLDEYDWYRHQAKLNTFRHLVADIDGEEMHAMLSSPERSDLALPLLLIHGWPNSFADYAFVVSYLTPAEERGVVFECVVPSLPGFGFSEPPQAPGLHPGRIAERLHRLMQELGHRRYGVQGGDWGAIIGTALALLHPEAVVGLHLTDYPGHPGDAARDDLSFWEQNYFKTLEEVRSEHGAYVAIQSTKPRSLGYALNDSPVGLLAWMLEKYWTWTDHRQDLWSVLDRDAVLTTVSLYWLTGTAMSAASIYYERAHSFEDSLAGVVQTPTAFLRFQKNPWGAPRSLVEHSYNLIQYSEDSVGGHFPVWERPNSLANDIRKFFTLLGR
jgi:pimeloyl-ACP methyl ester carboxylesterase